MPRLTDSDLLQELHRLATDDQPPTLQDMREQGKHSVTTYYNRFGSWQEALLAAGFDPRSPQAEVSDDELLAELKALAEELNERPSATQMNRHGDYWASTYRNHFGSWNAALEAAGFDRRTPREEIPATELINELQRVADTLDKTPSMNDFRSEGAYSCTVYRERFGSWNKAVRAAGLEPLQTEHTRADLLDELRRLATEFDQRPTVSLLREHGKYSLRTYQRRFDSWSNAVDLALEDS